ncbi:MAG: hypothetical protein QX197_16710 [Methylococcaceae bacterium]
MSEIIFILVVVFVAYVAYTVITDKNGAPQTTHLSADASSAEAVVVDDAIQAAINLNIGDELKNPATGEVSKIPNNYRFGKRWIKEALVVEGLLDKVYKNNELNDTINAKAQTAMATLATMDKYKA